MKCKNLFKDEEFKIKCITRKHKITENLQGITHFALDGVDRFSIILINLDFAYSYPKERRDLWERDLSNIKGEKNFSSGIYRVKLSFRTIQEFCEVYSWFIKLGKYHVESDEVTWNNDGKRYKHQWSLKSIQRRKWFNINDIINEKDLVFDFEDLGEKETWWYHINSDYPINPRFYSSDWAGSIYLHVPLIDIANGQLKHYMNLLKKELKYKCDWTAPIEIREDNGYSNNKYSCETLII